MKEPKITQMDWRSLGYWPVWKDGKKVWVPKECSHTWYMRENGIQCTKCLILWDRSMDERA
jgi:hypothetical protein